MWNEGGQHATPEPLRTQTYLPPPRAPPGGAPLSAAAGRARVCTSKGTRGRIYEAPEGARRHWPRPAQLNGGRTRAAGPSGHFHVLPTPQSHPHSPWDEAYAMGAQTEPASISAFSAAPSELWGAGLEGANVRTGRRQASGEYLCPWWTGRQAGQVTPSAP